MKILTTMMAALMCLTAPVLNAQYPSDCCYSFDGFYAGLGGGIATLMAEDEISTNVFFPSPVAAPEILTIDSNTNIYVLRPQGEIFVGWGRQCSCFYLGGRLGINFTRFNPSLKIESANIDPEDEGNAFLVTDLKTRLWSTEYTFDMKPGWLLSERTMLFGTIGGAINKQKLEGRSQFAVTNIIFDATNEVVPQKERCNVALRAGLGIEHMLSPCWSFQLAYVYTRYWKTHKNETVVTLVDDEEVVHTVDLTTRANKQVTSVALAYYF